MGRTGRHPYTAQYRARMHRACGGTGRGPHSVLAADGRPVVVSKALGISMLRIWRGAGMGIAACQGTQAPGSPRRKGPPCREDSKRCRGPAIGRADAGSVTKSAKSRTHGRSRGTGSPGRLAPAPASARDAGAGSSSGGRPLRAIPACQSAAAPLRLERDRTLDPAQQRVGRTAAIVIGLEPVLIPCTYAHQIGRFVVVEYLWQFALYPPVPLEVVLGSPPIPPGEPVVYLCRPE